MSSRLTNILPEPTTSTSEPAKAPHSPDPTPVEPDVDRRWLRNIHWAAEAPKGLVRAAREGDSTRFLRRWRRLLPKHSSRRRLEACGGAGAAVFDGVLFACMEKANSTESVREIVVQSLGIIPPVPSRETSIASDTRRNGHSSSEETDASSCEDSEERLTRLLSQRAEAGSRQSEGSPVSAGIAPADALALCDFLLFRGRDASDKTCLAAWNAIVQCLKEHGGLLVDPAGCESSALAQAALSGELLWKAGLLFAGLAEGAEWREAGRRRLVAALEEWTDASGRPAGDSLPALASAVGVTARSAAWGGLFEDALWNEDHAARFSAWVRTSIGMSVSAPQIALSGASPVSAALLDFAASVAGLREKSRPRRLLAALLATEAGEALRGKPLRALEEDVSEAKRASFQSDETLVASLRTSWSPTADLVAIRHDSATPTIEISLRGQPVFRGAWELEVRRNGRSVEFAPEWKATCWFSDDDADYLELQQILADGTHIERQLLLSRKLHCLVLADCVSHTGDDALELRSRLPLVTGVVPHNETATRECWLERDVLAVRAFPLALEDDRLHRANGSLIATDFAIELRQTSARGLFAPLVLDWHPDRANAPADWRKLTVSEDGKAVGIGHASGHRLRIGDHQIVVYRSLLRNDELRTVLGYHTAHETMIGLFDKDGDIHPLVLVE